MSGLSGSDYRTWRVDPASRGPLVDFMLNALREAGCRVLRASEPDEAPFRFVFETPAGERIGVVAYAFYANRKVTGGRPGDEHRMQVKYGSTRGLQTIWQDPFDLYTTIMVGISPEEGFFVGLDPVLREWQRFFVSVEFKDRHVEEIRSKGWLAWERPRRSGPFAEPVEVLVGGRAEHFLRFVQFERLAKGMDQGNRQLLADNPSWFSRPTKEEPEAEETEAAVADLHPLARDFELSPDEILDLVAGARRLRMAVRGWVAEEKLRAHLATLDGMTRCERLDVEGGPDLMVAWRGGPDLAIECKNVLRKPNAAGLAKVDFQRTRASIGDPCSRYYAATDFDIVAACLHAVTEKWEFRFVSSAALTPHARCVGKLASNVVVNASWSADAATVIEDVGRRMTS